MPRAGGGLNLPIAEDIFLRLDGSNGPMTGQIVFDYVGTTITTVTNQDLIFKPHGSGVLRLSSGSGGVVISTDSDNSDISLFPHGTGGVFLNDSLEVEADGSGPGAQSLSILKFANGDRIYAQTLVDRMFYTADRFEVLSKDGAETIASFNSSQSANADSVLFYKGIASGNYAGSSIPTNGFAFSGDCGIGTIPTTQLHVKMIGNTEITYEGNNNFGSNIWKKTNGTIMGYMGYSNTSGYITGSINAGMHMRATNGWTFGHGATLLLTMDNTDGLKMGSKRWQQKQGANVVAANDMTLGNDGNVFVITGNTTINGIATANWQEGSVIILRFSGTPTLKHDTAASAGFASFFFKEKTDFVPSDSNQPMQLVYSGSRWRNMM